MDLIKVAVITGWHSFDVLGFHRLFRSLDGVDAYIQHLNDFSSSPEEVRDSYDVVLFYFMPRPTPDSEGAWYVGKPKAALEHLGETKQGVSVLHHALLAYPDWPYWSEICGIADRGFDYFHDQTLPIEVARSNHPVAQGLPAWEMVDETYLMQDAGPDSEVLLTTDHPKSMRTLAWTRTHKQARVFCCALGHDDQAFSNPNFRELIRRGIVWSAGG